MILLSKTMENAMNKGCEPFVKQIKTRHFHLERTDLCENGILTIAIGSLAFFMK